MLIIDANAILRYILCDNADMANEVNKLISGNAVTIRYEVMAEVIYVLEKLYSMPRDEIANGIRIFLALPNVKTEFKDVLLLALETYSKMKFDFVDCLLYGFSAVCGYDIFTFDKSLNSLINKTI
ncbi:MAG: PIN domain-containing protein [Synergistaceae bacterium]|nr:PIN domain-containing protein [Synergistaceae bacterium]